MNYKVEWIDWFQNAIIKTDEEADNIDVFKNFTEAKKSLLRSIRSVKRDVNRQIERVQDLKKSDVV